MVDLGALAMNRSRPEAVRRIMSIITWRFNVGLTGAAMYCI